MLRIPELSQQIAAYRDAQISLDDFEDWFRSDSWGAYQADDSEISRVIVAIESALSKFCFQGISEELLREELAAAISLFDARNYATNDPLIRFPIASSNSNSGSNAFSAAA